MTDNAVPALHELMSEPVLTIEHDQNVHLAAQMMLWGGMRHLPVTRAGDLVGIVSERDLLAARPVRGNNAAVSEVMISPVVTMSPDDDIESCSTKMLMRRIGCIPVTDNGNVVGIVTRTDLLGHRVRKPRVTVEGATAEDVMTTNLITLGPEDEVLDAVGKMVRERVRHVPIVDGDGRLVGLVSDRDLRDAVGDPVHALREDAPRFEPFFLEAVMTKEPLTVTRDVPLDELVKLLVEEGVSAAAVVGEDQKLLGMVSYVDLLHFAFTSS
jgi:CBS-domain-containing membrane protein